MFCKRKRFENGCHFVSGDEEIIVLLKEISPGLFALICVLPVKALSPFTV